MFLDRIITKPNKPHPQGIRYAMEALRPRYIPIPARMRKTTAPRTQANQALDSVTRKFAFFETPRPCPVSKHYYLRKAD